MYKKLLHKENLDATAVSGEISENTIFLEGICKQIIVEPATSTTSYEINITDNEGTIVFETDTETGTYPELTDLPMRGIYTFNITSATNDEDFKIQLILEV